MMPPQAGTNYAGPIAASRAWAQSAIVKGLPPESVAVVIERALTATHPQTRYTVGKDAWIGANILARLPDRLRDRIMGMR